MNNDSKHGFSEQEFKGNPEQPDQDNSNEQYSHFFYEEGGHLVATPEASAGENGIQRGLQKIKATVIGKPIFSKDEIHERLTKFKALAVFGSDAISSCAYATEASLIVLMAAGNGASAYLVFHCSRDCAFAFNGRIFLPTDSLCLS